LIPGEKKLAANDPERKDQQLGPSPSAHVLGQPLVLPGKRIN
jgi:hypothetical protein